VLFGHERHLTVGVGVKRLLALILLPAIPCVADTSSTVSLGNGIQVEITTSFGAESGDVKVTAEMSAASGNGFCRIFWDENHLAVFAYELLVSRSSDGLEIRISTKPAGDDFAARYPDADGGKPTPTLSAPVDYPPLRSGGHLKIPLFHLPGQGVSVIDTVQVSVGESHVIRTASAFATQYPDELRFAALKVYSNGRLISNNAAQRTVAGKFAMFYVPGKGGYFFTTDPPAGRGFMKTGVVNGKRLRITVDNDTYDCVSEEPILMHNPAGEVWVYHDPGYKPAGNWTVENPQQANVSPADQFFTAASDSLSWWLPAKAK
jgi:hypothetical protein